MALSSSLSPAASKREKARHKVEAALEMLRCQAAVSDQDELSNLARDSQVCRIGSQFGVQLRRVMEPAKNG
jgi:hypothetical protein